MEQHQFQDSTKKHSILGRVDSPKDLKRLSRQQLKILAQEIREKILGSQIIINGKANKNEMFDRIEFIADSVEEINVKEEINYLLSNLK